MAGLSRVTKADLPGEIREYPVKAAETFKMGDFLTLTTDGYLTQTLSAATNGAALLYVGRALENATDDNGTLRTYIKVLLCQPGTRFWMPLYNTTAATALYTPGTSNSQATAGYELRYQSATAGFVVDISATTNKAVRIVDADASDYAGGHVTAAAGTAQYPWVLCEFVGAFCLFTGAR